MARALNLNTSHQHHCYGRNSMVQPIATTASHTGWPYFPSACLSISVSLYVFIFLLLFFDLFSFKFLFLLPACLWVWGFGFFLGLNDLEKEGILIWVPGCKKERIFVLSVQKVGFLAWVWLCFCVGILGLRVFYGWMCVCCVLCNACDV